MVIELRAKSQVTIPSKVVKDMQLEEGDQFEIVQKDGAILLYPVAVYPKAYVEQLEKEAAKTKKKLAAGTQPTFKTAKDMLAYLEKK